MSDTRSYKIFADVTADMNDKMLAEVSEVTFIPMNITVGGEGYCYSFGADTEITNREFYSKLESGQFASTSQINPGVYEEYFEAELEKGNDIIYLCFSSGLSETINSARMAIDELSVKYSERRMVLIDTLVASAGGGFLVYEAVREARRGLTIDELAEWVEERKLNVCHWFTVDTFEHLKRGGRVSSATAAVGTVLQIKPLLNVDNNGRLQTIGKPRGRKQATAALVEKLVSSWNPELGTFIVIGHADNLTVAEEIKQVILDKLPNANIEIVEIGPVIGAHTGPGMTAVIHWGKER